MGLFDSTPKSSAPVTPNYRIYLNDNSFKDVEDFDNEESHILCQFNEKSLYIPLTSIKYIQEL